MTVHCNFPCCTVDSEEFPCISAELISNGSWTSKDSSNKRALKARRWRLKTICFVLISCKVARSSAILLLSSHGFAGKWRESLGLKLIPQKAANHTANQDAKQPIRKREIRCIFVKPAQEMDKRCPTAPRHKPRANHPSPSGTTKLKWRMSWDNSPKATIV